jgi:hypothetical protein
LKSFSTNILPGKRTRRKPEPGDIFTFQMEQFPERFYYGRVVATDTKIGNMPIGVNLFYVYKTFSLQESDIPALKPSDLLVPPIGTNDIPWKRGYFKVIKSVPIAEGDVLPVHCFYSPSRSRYVDEYGNQLAGPVEPVGFNGLSGLGSIDNKICNALGVPVKPDFK